MPPGVTARRWRASLPDGPVPPEHAQYDFQGVAWGIDRVRMTAVHLGSVDPHQYHVGADPAEVNHEADWLAARVSTPTSADFVNMSFGIWGLTENYLDASFGASYRAAIRVLAQPDGQRGRRVLVIAAGNDHGHRCEAPEPNCVEGKIDASSPGVFAGLPVLEESLRGHVVAVAATDREGHIAVFSNRCGIAARWCIAAPGVRVPVAETRTDPDTGLTTRGYVEASGTSLAAPHVTGGLAVLKHLFRSQLTNDALPARLYATARVTPDAVAPGGSCPAHLDLDGDRSRCELSSVFGRGVMDLGAATAPVGETAIALGGRVEARALPARSSGILSSLATGDALSRGLAGRKIAVFDTLGAPFWIDAAGFVSVAPLVDPAARLSRWLAGDRGAVAVPSIDGTGDSWLPFAAGGLRFGLGAPEGAHTSLAALPAVAQVRFGNTVLSALASTRSDGEAGERRLDADVRALTLAWSPEGGGTNLRAGWIGETQSFLGTSANGAFGAVSSDLTFVGASRTFETGDWRFGMAAELGRATRDASGGIVVESGAPVISTAFSADAARPPAGRTLRLSLLQPLRIESGQLGLTLPVGRTPEGLVVRQGVHVDLEPSGRQVELGADWTQALAPSSVLQVGARLIREPGHVAGAHTETVAFAGLRIGL